MKTYIKRLFFIFLGGLLFLAGVIGGSWMYVEIIGAKKIVGLDEIPSSYRTAMMLGTSTRLPDGRRNLFHYNRVKAILELYQENKIDLVHLSGDNSEEGYNEPEDMMRDLVTYGIPDDVIQLDYAGFRTLDSVLRSRSAFQLDQIIIVSQRFHVERALTIAYVHGINAVGYVAEEVSSDLAPKVYIREVFARVKMMLDLYVLDVMPKFET